MVGGDFYDVWNVGGSWIMIIGDVTGKGIQAAALTSLVRHTVRSASEFDSSPAWLLAFIDRMLKKRPILSVCTALCLRVGLERATLAVGGHPLPLHVSGRRVREVGQHGPLLGAFPRPGWQDHDFEIEPGATLVAYTDGITDAMGAQERFGIRRLSETVAELADGSVEEMMAGINRALERFQVGDHTDDTAALALRRLPADGGDTQDAADAADAAGTRA